MYYKTLKLTNTYIIPEILIYIYSLLLKYKIRPLLAVAFGCSYSDSVVKILFGSK